MDFDLMFTSFPKLLGATVRYLKTSIRFIIIWNVIDWIIFCNFKT